MSIRVIIIRRVAGKKKEEEDWLASCSGTASEKEQDQGLGLSSKRAEELRAVSASLPASWWHL